MLLFKGQMQILQGSNARMFPHVIEQIHFTLVQFHQSMIHAILLLSRAKRNFQRSNPFVESLNPKLLLGEYPFSIVTSQIRLESHETSNIRSGDVPISTDKIPFVGCEIELKYILHISKSANG